MILLKNKPLTKNYEEILTTSGTWSKPEGVPDTATLTVICVGGGGNSGLTLNHRGGAGGGGGAALSIYKVADLNSVSYTVGAAGGNTQFLNTIGYAGGAGTNGSSSGNGTNGGGGYGVGLFVSYGGTSGNQQVPALAGSAGFDGVQPYGKGGIAPSMSSAQIGSGEQGAIYLRYEWVE